MGVLITFAQDSRDFHMTTPGHDACPSPVPFITSAIIIKSAASTMSVGENSSLESAPNRVC
jgi:hypothetical protein